MHLLHVAKAASYIVCWTLGHSDYASPSHSPQGYQLCLQTRKRRLLGGATRVSGPDPACILWPPLAPSCLFCPPAKPVLARGLHLPSRGAPSG